ncbi:MAG: hypothetical protein WBQ25_26060 [Nitrososphaeraceae archaeon]
MEVVPGLFTEKIALSKNECEARMIELKTYSSGRCSSVFKRSIRKPRINK